MIMKTYSLVCRQVLDVYKRQGLTYTYKIRKGVKWYTSDGEEYADVTAKDFVTGLKHAADTNSEAIYLLQNSVKGLNDYLSGANKDFSNVGIKAVDDYTVQYTLSQPEPYWNSKLTYSVTWPVNGEFLKSKGKDFGKSTDCLLYTSPFFILVKHRNFINFQNFKFKFNFKMSSDKFEQFTVI